MPDVLTDKSDVRCVHMAKGTAIPSNTKTKAEGGRILVVSDVHQVSGCPFMKGTVASPCVTIQWSAPAQKTKINPQAVLTNLSIGKCVAADQSTQGLAIVVNSKKAKSL